MFLFRGLGFGSLIVCGFCWLVGWLWGFVVFFVCFGLLFICCLGFFVVVVVVVFCLFFQGFLVNQGYLVDSIIFYSSILWGYFC